MVGPLDLDEINRTADIVMQAYGRDEPCRALDHARRMEARDGNKRFASAVRQEVERRCLVLRHEVH
ncbi:hypothetical protein GN330_16390 [Nitratireductor sp. CAU 1489]|uniref:Uncharacterized protein n=1 Tax=Nitratireductor arenosus TaxID=2682096 RepID=A0A844QI08_9HYPH|nr:hypothetical protein [Nitratireductor arenosus]MVA98827.1 hypothetical protein [Nitratireductor arenosus]